MGAILRITSALRITPAAGAALGAMLSACGSDAVVPVAAMQSELSAAVVDASFVGALSDGSAICVYHAADGQFLGRNQGLISGSWSVEDGTLCYAYTQGPEPRACRQAIFNGNRAVLLESGEVVGQGTFNEGNVCA